MLLPIVQIVFLAAMAVYLLVNRPAAKEISGVIAGVAAAVWALLILLGL